MRGGALGVRRVGLRQFSCWKEDDCRRYDRWHRTRESLAVGVCSRSKTLVRGPVPPKQRSPKQRIARDRRHWSADQWHPNRESLGSGPAPGRGALAVEVTGQGTSATQTKDTGQGSTTQTKSRWSGPLAIEDTGRVRPVAPKNAYCFTKEDTGRVRQWTPERPRHWLGDWWQPEMLVVGGRGRRWRAGCSWWWLAGWVSSS